VEVRRTTSRLEHVNGQWRWLCGQLTAAEWQNNTSSKPRPRCGAIRSFRPVLVY
jgi:hypothetical protein